MQVNLLRLKSSVSSKWASKLLWGYHLFCCWWYISSVIEIISDEISPASSYFLTTFSELWPPWCKLVREKLKTRRIALSNSDNPVQTYISTEEHGSVFIENREVVPVICSNTVSFYVIHEFWVDNFQLHCWDKWGNNLVLKISPALRYTLQQIT